LKDLPISRSKNIGQEWTSLIRMKDQDYESIGLVLWRCLSWCCCLGLDRKGVTDRMEKVRVKLEDFHAVVW